MVEEDQPQRMTWERIKARLDQAKSVKERQETLRLAIKAGISLQQIEEYLDWLDHTRRNGK